MYEVFEVWIWMKFIINVIIVVLVGFVDYFINFVVSEFFVDGSYDVMEFSSRDEVVVVMVEYLIGGLVFLISLRYWEIKFILKVLWIFFLELVFFILWVIMVRNFVDGRFEVSLMVK